MNYRVLPMTVTSRACGMLVFVAANALAQSPAPETCSNAAVPATTPSNEFTIVGDGSIVRHEATGLEWRRCSIGQSWDGTTCQGTPSTHTWQQSLDIAGNSGGNWRLPNIQELRSIVERCRQGPAINRQVFPNTPSSNFWSASPFAGNSGLAWYVGFNDGNDFRNGTSNGLRVRLVRAGQ